METCAAQAAQHSYDVIFLLNDSMHFMYKVFDIQPLIFIMYLHWHLKAAILMRPRSTFPQGRGQKPQEPGKDYSFGNSEFLPDKHLTR